MSGSSPQTPSPMDRTGGGPGSRRWRSSSPAWKGTSTSAPSRTRCAPSSSRAMPSSLIARYCANTRIAFGIQSGSDPVLGRIGRGHSVADGIRAVELCRDHGFTPVVDLIMGFPFETGEDENATLEAHSGGWSRSGRVRLHAFIPLPGTPLAGTSPRPVSPRAERLLGKLALAGKLTGSWKNPAIRFSRPSDERRLALDRKRTGS